MPIFKKKEKKMTVAGKPSSLPSEAKFISVVLKNRVEWAEFVEININFLGSGHAASKHPGAGEQYGRYEHVYYNFKFSWENNVQKVMINFTFSGPTRLDLLKPNIRSITKEAQDVLGDLISNINLLKKVIVMINIQGHSRGGIVANNIKEWISSYISKWNNVRLGNFSIADPYAGPVNRRIDEKKDNFDKYSNHVQASDSADIFVPSNKIVVYTVAERRFRTPARSLESQIIVISDVSHDKTKYIAEFIFRNINKYKNWRVWILADPNKELKKMIDVMVKKKPTSAEQRYIDKWMEEHIKKVDEGNIDDILQGKDNYKNFAYNRISSDGRKALFYKNLALVDRGPVKDFLIKNRHASMCRKIQEM